MIDNQVNNKVGAIGSHALLGGRYDASVGAIWRSSRRFALTEAGRRLEADHVQERRNVKYVTCRWIGTAGFPGCIRSQRSRFTI
jgi:predicted heme/steroid binding protein